MVDGDGGEIPKLGKKYRPHKRPEGDPQEHTEPPVGEGSLVDAGTEDNSKDARGEDEPEESGEFHIVDHVEFQAALVVDDGCLIAGPQKPPDNTGRGEATEDG